MTHAIVIRPAAASDVEEARNWYDARRAGLGREFLDALEACLARIAERPEGYPKVLRDARRALMQRFPYSVYYRIRGAEVRILAVIHQSRDPQVWRRCVQ